MCHNNLRATTGSHSTFAGYEQRKIVIVEGLDYHESDMEERQKWQNRWIRELQQDCSCFRRTDDEIYPRMMRRIRRYGYHRRRWSDDQIADRLIRRLRRSMEWSAIQYLEDHLPAFDVDSERKNAEYISVPQRVVYELEIKQKKSEYKAALQTPGIIVIYDGHSRYGRGACFDQYTGKVAKHGEHWENGNDADDGLFRLGFDYVPVAVNDIKKHHYRFAPISADRGEPRPERERDHPHMRHPGARRRLSRVRLQESLRQYVDPGHRSPSHRYYGLWLEGELNLLLNAGWSLTNNGGMDLGATNLRCRTFCHFGCSSKRHYWHIVRRSEYKAWERPDPPTDRFAYFTTGPSDHRVSSYWLYYLLTYDEPRDNPGQWFASHQDAMTCANRKLRRDRAGYQIW